jgi:lysophospholipase L1-like esterase
MGSRFARALRRFIVNLIIVIVGVCVALLIAEVALRALKGRHPIATARYGKIPDVTERGTYLPWVLRPGAVDRQVDPYGEFDCEFRINSSGLRDDEVASPKPAGVKRILMLGDSMTVGWGVEQSESFAGRLDALLNRGAAAGSPGTRYEVVNCGWASWYTTDGAYVFLEHRIDELDPDLVVLDFFLNDPAELRPDDWRPRGATLPDSIAATREAGGAGGVAAARKKVRDYLAQRSYVMNLMKRIWQSSIQRRALKEDVFTLDAARRAEYPACAVLLFAETYPPDLEERFALTERLLAAMRDLSAEHGARFAVAIMPADFQVVPEKRERYGILPVIFHDQPYVEGKAQRRVTDVCRRNGIPVIDVLPALLKRCTGGCFYTYDPHPTPVGHAIIAEAIADSLRSSGLLD